MNKIHKTIWSQTLNQWVVGSELTRGHTKSSTIKKFVTALATTTVLLPTLSWGTCSITGSYVTGQTCTTSVSVDVNGANISNNGGNSLKISNGAGNAIDMTVDGNNRFEILDYAAAGTDVGFGMHVQAVNGGDVKFTGGTTDIVLGADQGDTGILFSVSAGSGPVVLTVDSGATLNITNNADWRASELDGIELTSDKDITFTHKGQGTIITRGGNAVYAKNTGNSGDITLNLVNDTAKNNVQLTTHGDSASYKDYDGHHGISSRLFSAANTTGVINIQTNAQIDTSGNNSNGIFAQVSSGTAGQNNIVIGNHGDITTQGVNASGVIALGNTGNIVIENTGIIRTQNASAGRTYSHGIYALTTDGDVAVHNAGVIETSSGDSAGIRVEQDINSTSGNIFVTTGATSIITSNLADAEGIHANIGSEVEGSASASSGSIVINALGSITTNGNGSAEGIYAAITKGATNTAGGAGTYSTGDIHATFAGDTIQTTGTGTNRGIYIRQDGVGATTAEHFGRLISTQGDGAHGIYTLMNNIDSTATARVLASGDITTQGDNASGIRESSLGNHKLEVDYSAGTVTTAGVSSHAVHISRNNAVQAAQGIQVDLTNAKINTSGYNSHGVFITTQASLGNVDVTVNNTDMNLSGGNSDGIDVQRNSGNPNDVSDIDFNIVTNGGIWNILDTTTLTGGGSNYGIVAYQYGAAQGDINVTNNGTKISTGLAADGSGAGSNPISVSFRDNTATGHINIKNSGELSTQGQRAHGIYADNEGTGDIQIINTGAITTHGLDARGIYARSTQGGRIELGNTGNITTYDATPGGAQRSFAILAEQATAGASDGIRIEQAGSTISTKGYDATGIRAFTWANSGDVDLYVKNSIINVDGVNGDGILIQKDVYAPANISNLNLNVTVKDSTINVLQNPSMAIDAYTNFGIAAIQNGAAAGNINIVNSNTNINIGLGQTGVTTDSAAIYAIMSADATGNIDIQNDGALHSKAGVGAAGNLGVIHARNSGTGNVNVLNLGDILAEGDSAYGIRAESRNGGHVTIESHANVNVAASVHSQTVKGIAALADGGGDAAVTASGNISVLGTSLVGVPSAIEVRSNQGNATINYANGAALSHGSTLVVWDWNSGAGKKGLVNIGPNAYVASSSDYAIVAKMSGGNEVNIDTTSRIDGHRGINVGTVDPTADNVINNYGVIDVEQDIAIYDDSVAGVTTVVNNWGTIIGQVQHGAAKIIFNNYSPNSLNLRNYIDTDGDGIRDTQSVAVANFGGGDTTFNNTGTGAVRMTPVPLSGITINNAGEYVPSGALSINHPGILQGHITGLSNFVNSGTIELSNNGQAGDVLVITAGMPPGVNGGGQYISNGGSLKVDTLLNQGDIHSLSDILVVDNTTTAAGPTNVYVTPTFGSTGLQTLGDGIKIVEVLGTTSANAFTLGTPVTYGEYEYLMGNGLGANDQNWYLQNFIRVTPGNPSAPEVGKVYLTNPNVGSYLGNQYAAATMFNHNILDRRDSIHEPDQTLWARINYGDAETHMFGNKQKLKQNTTVIQAGADLFKKDNIVAGVFVGYGHAKTDTKSKQTGTKSNGKVNGYQLGVYGSWMPEQHKGPYVDLWAHYGWYKNTLGGQSLSKDSKYNSHGLAASIEAGYGFELKTNPDGSAWIIKPHAQLIYSNIDADSFTDTSNTRYSGNKASGIQTRLGARLYEEKAPGTKGISPFVEANWLHNGMNNSVKANTRKVDNKIGKNIGEVKIGIQGNLTDKFSIWGHVGGQKGSDSYKRYEAQIGLGWQWK